MAFVLIFILLVSALKCELRKEIWFLFLFYAENLIFINVSASKAAVQ